MELRSIVLVVSTISLMVLTSYVDRPLDSSSQLSNSLDYRMEQLDMRLSNLRNAIQSGVGKKNVEMALSHVRSTYSKLAPYIIYQTGPVLHSSKWSSPDDYNLLQELDKEVARKSPDEDRLLHALDRFELRIEQWWERYDDYPIAAQEMFAIHVASLRHMESGQIAGTNKSNRKAMEAIREDLELYRFATKDRSLDPTIAQVRRLSERERGLYLKQGDHRQYRAEALEDVTSTLSANASNHSSVVASK